MPTNSKQRDARRFEDDLARDLLGRRVPFSGAGRVKADVRKSASYGLNADGIPVRREALTFRIEAKTTWRTTFNFRLADWHDLLRAARASGEHPIFAIRFLTSKDEVAIAPASLMMECGVHVDLMQWLDMRKSRLVRPDTQGRIFLTELASAEAYLCHLAVLPYHTFLERIRSHALYRPNEEDQHADAP